MPSGIGTIGRFIMKTSLPLGFKTFGINCGIKKSKKDLGLIYSSVSAIAAGTFTKNQFCAAPVQYTKKVIKNQILQAVIVNSGNANCYNGKQSMSDAILMAKTTGDNLGISPSIVAVASTGPIGKPLPIKNIVNGINTITKQKTKSSLTNLSNSILTTDTCAKEITKKIKIGKRTVTITGIAKGAGMIYPNMATMLCFIMTDLNIKPALLQKLLSKSVDNSFNCISVDSCMSTNDTVLLLANGLAKNPKITKISSSYKKVQTILDEITHKLAQMIIADGEGITKIIQINVKGVSSENKARTIGFQIADSNLLKCAFYGENLNWGRIISAIGAGSIAVNPNIIDIYIGKSLIVKKGCPVKYNKQTINKLLKNKYITVTVNLNKGKAQNTIWTNDLTPEYVKINMN